MHPGVSVTPDLSVQHTEAIQNQRGLAGISLCLPSSGMAFLSLGSWAIVVRALLWGLRFLVHLMDGMICVPKGQNSYVGVPSVAALYQCVLNIHSHVLKLPRVCVCVRVVSSFISFV